MRKVYKHQSDKEVQDHVLQESHKAKIREANRPFQRLEERERLLDEERDVIMEKERQSSFLEEKANEARELGAMAQNDLQSKEWNNAQNPLVEFFASEDVKEILGIERVINAAMKDMPVQKQEESERIVDKERDLIMEKENHSKHLEARELDAMAQNDLESKEWNRDQNSLVVAFALEEPNENEQ